MPKKDSPNQDRFWNEPLTDSEKSIIAKICNERKGAPEHKLMITWLNHVVKVSEAQARKLAALEAVEPALRELITAVEGEVLEYWQMGGYRQPQQNADLVINAVKAGRAALDGQA
jgi:hypothetical protein